MICISDLSITERGLKCGCHCVACEAPLIARMGDVNQHHFAHSTKLCDEGEAYVLAMYMLMKELLDKRKQILLPGFKAAYKLVNRPITIEQVEQMVKIVPINEVAQIGYKYEVISQDKLINIGTTTIQYRSNKQVEALVIEVSGKQLAIKIDLPDSVCQRYAVRSYKDLSTLEIDFSADEYDLNALTKQEIESILIDQIENKRWISNHKVKAIYTNVLSENEQYVEECEKRRQEYLKVQEKKKEQEKEKRKSLYQSRMKLLKPEITEKPNALSQEQYEEGQKEIMEVFNKDSSEIIRDKFGWRWVYCMDCYEIKREDQMSVYGGVQPNKGRCSMCF